LIEVQAGYIKRILCSRTVTLDRLVDMQSYRKALHFIRQSPGLKSYYRYFMSMICSVAVEREPVLSVNRNKEKYKQYRRRLCYLTQNIHHDAVSGWLMLASFYYKMKQYNTALYSAFLYDCISTSLSKVTVREHNIRLIYPACTSALLYI
jgi:hypothetical protein